ncbi:MAG: amino acid adenylation domain-containing protein, partial [bacterium]|nr:amino acid adenylation domain-containing protein [bacterium]
ITVFEGMELSISYDKKLFEKESIVRLTHHFKNILQDIINNPRQPVSTVQMMTEKEIRQVLYEFNATEADYPGEKTIHQLFEEQVEKAPDSISAIHESPSVLHPTTYHLPPATSIIQLTNREINERAHHLAAQLQEKGITPGAVAAMAVPSSVETVITILAIWKAGGVYLPIDITMPVERIKYMLADANAKILLTGSREAHSKEQQTRQRQLSENIAILSTAHPQTTRGERSHRQTETGGNAYIIYTSGTTGKPKGVVVPHSAYVNRLYWLHHRYGFDSSDVIMQKTPITFDVSLCELFRWIPGGGRVLIMKAGAEKDPEIMQEAIEKHHATTIDFVPSMLNLYLEYIENNKAQAGAATLRWVFVGVEPIGPGFQNRYNRIWNKTVETQLVHTYGPTEATIDITGFDCSAGPPREIVPIGRPIHNTQIYIRDKHGNIQPPGVPGELCIAGKSLASGYLNNPELTAERFVKASWQLAVGSWQKKLYRTGDLARWLPDGNIEFLGRIDHQVKIRGMRVELGEIERSLLTHPEIKEVVVLLREIEKNDNILCAYVVLGQGKQTIEMKNSDNQLNTALREHLAHYLPGYMIPAHFIRQKKIPLTPTGKIDRKALSQIQISNLKTQTYIAPRNETEKKMTDIWTDILGHPQEKLGIDDDFFQIGGHSLKATLLAARIHKQFDIKLSLTEIFKNTTIRTLTDTIKGKIAAASPGLTTSQGVIETFAPIKPAEKKQYYILSSAQKRLYILQQMELESTAYNMPHIIPINESQTLEKLEDTFRKLIKRHDSLRTSFHMISPVTPGEEIPVQVVHEQVSFKIERFKIDKTHGGQKDSHHKEENQLRRAQREFFRTFDLAVAPLLRVRIVETTGTGSEPAKPDQNRYMLIDMHHIITDGTSQDILIKEFFILNTEKSLPPLKHRYRDYAEWQSSSLQKQTMKQQEEYWVKKFSGEIPVLNLPTDFPRPLIQSIEGNTLQFTLNEKETENLKTITRESKITLYMTLLSIYTLLLSKLSGQEDIIVGTPTAGRQHADLENIIGMFVNTLPMRNYTPGAKT